MTNEKIHEMIRVNQAGEMGAKIIYEGQKKALKLKGDTKTLKLIEHMQKQEIEHFDYFDKLLKDKNIRPTIMQPIWQVGGFIMGFATAMIDKKAAMTCTTAVEEVIDDHYQEQLDYLDNIETHDKNNNKDLKELKDKITQFRQEELEHRDIGYDNGADKLIFFKPLSALIKHTTKLAILFSKKI